MKVVGLTGGIGSGKTTVGNIFKRLGIPVYDSDSRAKALYIENVDLRKCVEEEFGADIYSRNQIDRAKLAAIVFQDKSKLEVLNGLVHPVLNFDFEHWANSQEAPYVIREAAILLESGGYKVCDAIVVVTADESIRIARVQARDGATTEQVKARIQNQWSDQKRLEYADYEIRNNGEESLIDQVMQIHEELKSGK